MYIYFAYQDQEVNPHDNVHVIIVEFVELYRIWSIPIPPAGTHAGVLQMLLRQWWVCPWTPEYLETQGWPEGWGHEVGLSPRSFKGYRILVKTGSSHIFSSALLPRSGFDTMNPMFRTHLRFQNFALWSWKGTKSRSVRCINYHMYSEFAMSWGSIFFLIFDPLMGGAIWSQLWVLYPVHGQLRT